MLLPKRVKYRRVQQRSSYRVKLTVVTRLLTVNYGLQALEPSWITSNQIEAARVAMTRYMQAWRSGLD